jgi:cysteine desulfurase
MERLYLDYNASAPLRPEARAAMVDALSSGGNASSVHMEGRAARSIIDRARTHVANLVAGESTAVTFTSGGSEANATVLTPRWRRSGKPLRLDYLVISAVEHPSVLAGGQFRPEQIRVVPVDGKGLVDLVALDEILAGLDGQALVSVMLANNETGVIQPMAEVVTRARAHGALIHADAVQAAGRMPVDLVLIGVDVLTLSAHKIGGPQGAGAIVRMHGAPVFEPLIIGGGQESRHRAGTENVAALAGFGVAAQLAMFDEAEELRWRGLIAEFARVIGNEATVFGAEAQRLPQTLCFGLPGVSAETLVIALDLEGVAISSGAACSSGKVGPSHVMAAMGISPELAKSSVRISLGWDSTEKSLYKFAEAWQNVITRITPDRV